MGRFFPSLTSRSPATETSSATGGGPARAGLKRRILGVGGLLPFGGSRSPQPGAAACAPRLATLPAPARVKENHGYRYGVGPRPLPLPPTGNADGPAPDRKPAVYRYGVGPRQLPPLPMDKPLPEAPLDQMLATAADLVEFDTVTLRTRLEQHSTAELRAMATGDGELRRLALGLEASARIDTAVIPGHLKQPFEDLHAFHARLDVKMGLIRAGSPEGHEKARSPGQVEELLSQLREATGLFRVLDLAATAGE